MPTLVLKCFCLVLKSRVIGMLPFERFFRKSYIATLDRWKMVSIYTYIILVNIYAHLIYFFPSVGFFYIDATVALEIMCRDKYGFTRKQNLYGNHAVTVCLCIWYICVNACHSLAGMKCMCNFLIFFFTRRKGGCILSPIQKLLTFLDRQKSTRCIHLERCVVLN